MAYLRDGAEIDSVEWRIQVRSGDGIDEKSNFAFHPSSLTISSFPNPFNSSTTITYSLPRPGRYALSVVDLTGREVAMLSEAWREAGSYREVWDGNRLTSGQYLIRLGDGVQSRTLPVMLVR